MKRHITYPFLILILLLSACSWFGGGQNNENTPANSQDNADTQSPTQTAEPLGPLPPAVVEVSPLAGSELSIDGAVTFYFNQSMNQPSVEAALSVSPVQEGLFEWIDSATMVYRSIVPWPLNAQIKFTFAETALAENGLAMQSSASFSYNATDGLLLAQMLPTPNTFEVDPTSAVVASFNRPVTPLGADLTTFAPAFTLSPQAEGRGEWLNTSTYIFYPAPGLSGGQLYTVRLDESLESTQGLPVTGQSEWSFMTALPDVVSVSPAHGSVYLPLDQSFTLKFNQPMNIASVEQHFSLSDSTETPLAGTFDWDEDLTQFTFTPESLLDRNFKYQLTLDAQAQGYGGTPIGESHAYTFVSVGNFEVLNTRPLNGGQINYYTRIQVEFYSPIQEGDLSDFISVEPSLDLNYYVADTQLNIEGAFEPGTQYTLTISGALQDAWGSSLRENYHLTFTVENLDPGISVPSFLGSGTLWVNPDEPNLTAQARSVSLAEMQVGVLSLDELIFLEDFNNYQERQQFIPTNLEQYNLPLQVGQNQNQVVNLSLTRDGSRLTPGLYWVKVNPDANQFNDGPNALIVSSYVNLLTKVSGKDVFVWAVDQRTQAPVSGHTVTLYGKEGGILVTGQTDQDGIFQAAVPDQDPYQPAIVVMDNPGDEFFSLASLGWSLEGWYSQSSTRVYLYTDRPIYQPGDTVYFHGILREGYYGEYEISDISTLSFVVGGYNGDITEFETSVSEFGTVNGSFELPSSTIPSGYSIQVINDEAYASVYFEVAEYRKPEIDLQVDIIQEELLPGQTLTGMVDSRYFFNAPVSDLEFDWRLFSESSYFSLPGYSVGPITSFYWRNPNNNFGPSTIDSGTGFTDLDGQDILAIEAEYAQDIRTYTLSITMQDESGYYVSTADTLTVHPASFYIGVKPEHWIGTANSPFSFDTLVVDWDRNPAGARTFTAAFSEVEWIRQRNPFGYYDYIPEYTLVDSTTFTTGDNGKFNLEFTPPSSGVYLLEVNGGGAVTETLVWIGGSGQAAWPTRDNGAIDLLADQEGYQPGDTAEIFIPNPFAGGAQALITIERGQVFDSQVLDIDGASFTLPVDLTQQHAPNAYLTVTLLGRETNGRMGYRYGSVNLPVDPAANILNVEVLGDPSRVGPNETTTLTIRVTDADGSPARGQFSLAVVDEAIFALADPNVGPIEEYFYREQSIGVLTGISLLAAADRYEDNFGPGGKGGGGGGGDALALRDEFKDTAYWSGTIVTDQNGTAQVEVTMPENLTTWRVTVRGITIDTKVGEAQSEIITTKQLLIRPVTPRFFVAGDHAQITAIIHNTTDSNLEIEVAVLFEGFTLDVPGTVLRTINVPAGGRTPIEWWGTVQDVEAVSMIFSAEGGGLQDLTTPADGEIPVLRYSAPQTFATAGTLDEGGERLEVISLPRTFDPTSGSLQIQLSPSLAGGLLESLSALEEHAYETTEYTVSRLFANLETYLALQQFSLSDPDLAARLDDAVQGGINKLHSSINYDGGWGWVPTTDYNRQDSDPYITAYVVLSLTRASEAGFEVPEWVYNSAIGYLTDFLFETQNEWIYPWEFDRAVFIQYALTAANTQLFDQAYYLYDQRAQLNPWSQALLGLTWHLLSPNDERAQTLFSDLQGKAIRSATGVHWQDTNASYQNMSTAISNTSMVTYALAQYDPASPLLPDAARYLMAHRDVFGMWTSPYATAWSVLALNQVMTNTGELSSEYAFSSELNNRILSQDQAGASNLAAVLSEVDIQSLLPKEPNQLFIRRDPGEGRLYYSAVLQLFFPVDQVAPLNRGVSVTREYFDPNIDCLEKTCMPIQSTQAGEAVRVQVTITVPYDMYYLTVEDYIPAGSEIVNRRLNTYQYLDNESDFFNPRNPYHSGWGWWVFSSPNIYKDHIIWMADFLPAGTYQLEYTLVTLQPGEYQVIPARAWQLYFPEVQGSSAGEVFGILP